MNIPVKLAERPQREQARRRRRRSSSRSRRASAVRRSACRCAISIAISPQRFKLPDGMQGVVVSRVEPMSPAFDAEVERGHVLLEINRQPGAISRRLSPADRERRIPGDILTLYIYRPERLAGAAYGQDRVT